MANHNTIPFQQTGYFSKIICDYLDKASILTDYYHNFPDLNGFKAQIALKSKSFSSDARSILVASLQNQYHGFEISELTKANLSLLKQSHTFTVTTGHQLNLFTGPLYFLYKIVSAINLADRLKEAFPESNFVPVYWMATEDHDFEEIQYFNFEGKKINWDRDAKGAVGKLSTSGLDKVFEKFAYELGQNIHAEKLKALFQEAYLKHDNLSDATRYLANALFGKKGLIIIDGDDQQLKNQFVPYAKTELVEHTCFKEVNETVEKLALHYKIQVNPREINLFYLDDNLRERIVYEDGLYKVLNTDKVFTEEEILKELEMMPQKFSPNVLLRPLYQEVVLPNLCYIGGGGELAYWFELKSFFESQQVPLPILLLRNSVLLHTEKQVKKMEKLNVSMREMFKKQNELIADKVRSVSEIPIDFSSQRSYLKQMFKELEVLSDKTDRSFLGAVKAQEKKQLNGIDQLEKRLLKAQKRKFHEITERISVLQDALFPKQSLQERQANFSEFYKAYGDDLIENLIESLDPLKLEFDLITM